MSEGVALAEPNTKAGAASRIKGTLGAATTSKAHDLCPYHTSLDMRWMEGEVTE